MKRIFFLLTLLLAVYLPSPAQLRVPLKINEPAPSFEFKDIQYYHRASISSSELAGKWVVLDFWSPSCVPCIKGMPKFDSLKKTFSDIAEFFFISWDYGLDGIEAFDRFRTKYRLDVAFAINNKMFNDFGVSGVPVTIVIDPSGIVRYHSDNDKPLDSSILHRVIYGNGADTTDAVADFVATDSIIIAQSLLKPWNPAYGLGITHISSAYGNTIECSGMLKWLYWVAFTDTVYSFPLESYHSMQDNYGTYWREPVLQVKDSALFQWDGEKNINCFYYSLTLPPGRADATRMQEAMQEDLRRIFGFDASIEIREMPCWLLTTTDQSRKKLSARSGKTVREDYFYSGFKFKNVPVKEIIVKLFYSHQVGPLFIDDTGITGNIDIEINADLTDFSAFKNALEKQGIYLVKDTRPVRVLVIRDK